MTWIEYPWPTLNLTQFISNLFGNNPPTEKGESTKSIGKLFIIGKYLWKLNLLLHPEWGAKTITRKEKNRWGEKQPRFLVNVFFFHENRNKQEIKVRKVQKSQTNIRLKLKFNTVEIETSSDFFLLRQKEKHSREKLFQIKSKFWFK